MRTISLTLCRILLSAWVGAGILFVIVAVREVTSPEFTSLTKSQLALLRFPVYYVFGTTAWLLSMVSLLIAYGHQSLQKWQWVLSLILLGIAGAVLLIDYALVYLPLAEMTRQFDQPRTPRFDYYHKASMWINTLQLMLSLVTAMIISTPLQGSMNKQNPENLAAQ